MSIDLKEGDDLQNRIEKEFLDISDESSIQIPRSHNTPHPARYFGTTKHEPFVSNRLFVKDKAMEQKCLLLLQNLISEQLTHRFDLIDFRSSLCQDRVINFKFFLNSMEILAQLLDVIDIRNYSYRTSNHDGYEVI